MLSALEYYTILFCAIEINYLVSCIALFMVLKLFWFIYMIYKESSLTATTEQITEAVYVSLFNPTKVITHRTHKADVVS